MDQKGKKNSTPLINMVVTKGGQGMQNFVFQHLMLKQTNILHKIDAMQRYYHILSPGMF